MTGPATLETIATQDGDTIVPGFGADDHRHEDLDLFISLGASFDPRRLRIREMKVTIPVLRPYSLLPSHADLAEVKAPRYEFFFHGRPYDGRQNVLCVKITNHDGAEPFSRSDWFAEIAYAACWYYSRNL